MGIAYNTSIVTSGLVFSIDAGNVRSYSGSGITAYGLVGGLGGTLVNGVGFTSSNSGTFSFDGSNDYINIPTTTGLDSTNVSWSFWYRSSSFVVITPPSPVTNNLAP